MLVIEHYFWLICGLWFGLGCAILTRLRLQKRITSGELTKSEVDTFTKNYILWNFVPCMIFWCLQLSVGSSAKPQFGGWPLQQKTIALLLQIYIWYALINWIFLKNGAHTLSNYMDNGQKMFRFIYRPLSIKICAVVAVVGGIAGIFN